MYTVRSKVLSLPMFKKKEIPKSINFLEPINTPTDGWGNTIDWISQIGRGLLIIVEIVVVGIFASRFILDKQNNDLAEEINSRVTVLENNTWKQNTVKYDNIQKLLTDIQIVQSGQKLNSAVISEISGNIPTTLNVRSFSVSDRRISLSIDTTDFKSLKDYEDSLKNNQYYSDVKFNIVKSDSDLEVSVSFVLNDKI